jgi:hypothetical protein
VITAAVLVATYYGVPYIKPMIKKIASASTGVYKLFRAKKTKDPPQKTPQQVNQQSVYNLCKYDRNKPLFVLPKRLKGTHVHDGVCGGNHCLKCTQGCHLLGHEEIKASFSKEAQLKGTPEYEVSEETAKALFSLVNSSINVKIRSRKLNQIDDRLHDNAAAKAIASRSHRLRPLGAPLTRQATAAIYRRREINTSIRQMAAMARSRKNEPGMADAIEKLKVLRKHANRIKL